jgi:cysteinyl-tRNA synthetase
MSKSLKNFITIKEALTKYSARQLRIMFIQHGWHSVLDYKESSMTAAVSVESTFFNFFTNVAALLRENDATADESDGTHDYREDEKALMKK